jgi:adenylate kinase family enzyme
VKFQYIIIRGPLGCGKSTISEKLAKKLDATHIAYDRIVDGRGLNRDKEEGYISQRSFFKANDIAVGEAKKFFDSEKVVIFDGNFYWKSQLDDLIEKLNDSKGIVFTLKALVETCIKRDSERDKTHGEVAARVVHKKSTSFTYGNEIDTDGRSSEETVNEILEELRLR